MNTITPTIYEIDTPIFLYEVGLRVGHAVTLADVPDAEWDEIARPGIDTVWFMGVWKRSPIAREMAKGEDWLKQALPDIHDKDLLGSAYSIQDYVVDDLLGGNEGLAIARKELAKRGIKIILDYVPNHVAIDHVWVAEHPDYFLAGTEHELQKHPEAFVQTPGGIFAKGKDPNFEPWSDVLQLNAFSAPLRQEVSRTLRTIAGMSDGVRCDMAMLMMNTIFTRTWAERAGEVPHDDYWPGIINDVREVHPDFLFLAEVYWDKQQDLLDQGFDLCYDKDLYDYLLDGSVHKVKAHLQKPVSYQNHLLRFIENHDEERTAHEFPLAKHKAAAITTMTLPGAHLYYDGQREGRTIRVPVHLGRRVDEAENNELIIFYDKLLSFVQAKDFAHKSWQLTPLKSKFLRKESRHVLAWTWTSESSELVFFVNYSNEKTHTELPFNKKLIVSVTDIGNEQVNQTEHIISSKLLLDPWQHIVVELKK
jgi:glycosidase